MDKYFLVNVQQDASPDWHAVVKAATAEQAAEAAIAAWEGECAMAPAHSVRGILRRAGK